MVSTSCGSSILFTASIFFGSADNPLLLQVCPKRETFGRPELHSIWVQCQIVLSANFQKVQEISIMFMICFSINDYVISLSLWHLVHLRKSHQVSCWNTSCAMMAPIGSLVHWKHPMSSAKVLNFLESRWSSTIQYPLLKSAMVNWVITWNFPSISLILLSVVWFTFKVLNLGPLGQGKYLSFFCTECTGEWALLESAGTFFSIITKLLTHSVTSLTGSKIPNQFQIPNFLVESFLKMNRIPCLGACLSGLDIWL